MLWLLSMAASLNKCVFLSTSKATRERMKPWRDSTPGCLWSVKLDVQDLGGHLDVTLRAWASTLDNRATEATSQVILVGPSPWGSKRMLGLFVGKSLHSGLHGCEEAALSVSALGSFRTAIAFAAWSKR